MAGSSFEESVRAVLSDTMNLPQDFLGYLVQNQALNPIPVAKTSGMRIAYGSHTSNVSTAGTTFAAGADLLSAAIEFTASGSNSYLVVVSAPTWSNSTSGALNTLRLNLDGADGGLITEVTSPGVGQDLSCNGSALIVTPSAGEHSVNVRLSASAGTVTLNGGPGGSGQFAPIVVTLEVA